MIRKILLVIVIAACWIGNVYGDFRAEGDLFVRAGNVFMKKSSTLSSGSERDDVFQRARVLFQRAIELYTLHLEDASEDSAQLSPLITELNSRIFWCNKSTTGVYNKMRTPTAEKAFEESGLDPKSIKSARGKVNAVLLEELLGEPEPLSPEEALKLANKKKTASFLESITYFVSYFRFGSRVRHILAVTSITSKASPSSQ